MSLKQRITQSVNRAFIALDDLAGPMEYSSLNSDPSYDANTGLSTESRSNFIVQAIFDNYETNRQPGTMIQEESRKILVKPLTGLSPKVGDTIQDADEIVYTVMNVNSITAYNQVFLWELMVNK